MLSMRTGWGAKKRTSACTLNPGQRTKGGKEKCGSSLSILALSWKARCSNGKKRGRGGKRGRLYLSNWRRGGGGKGTGPASALISVGEGRGRGGERLLPYPGSQDIKKKKSISALPLRKKREGMKNLHPMEYRIGLGGKE